MSFNKIKKGTVVAASGLTVTGTSTFSNSITMLSTLNVSGTTTINGNVGIGTTTPSVPLEVNGYGYFKNTNNWSLTKVMSTAAANAAAYVASPYGTFSSSNPEWFIGHRHSAQGPLSIWNFDGTNHNSNILTVSTTGNLGINNTNPAYKLDINGGGCVQINRNTVDASITSSYAGYYSYSQTGKLFVGVDGNGFGNFAPDSGLIGTWTNTHMLLATNSTERVRILNTGNVGIGTTNPLSLLELNQATYSKPVLILDAGTSSQTIGAPRGIGQPLMRLGKTSYSTTAGDYYGMALGYAANATDYSCTEIGTLITDKSGCETGDIVFSTRATTANTVASERMRINSSGNVGINTTSPNDKLTIQAPAISTFTGPSAFAGIHIQPTSNTGSADSATGITWSGTDSGNYNTHAGIMVQGSGSYGTKMYFQTTNGWGVGTQNRMMIDHNGNVGIGTTSPQSTLQVNGTYRIVDTTNDTILSFSNGNGTFAAIEAINAANTVKRNISFSAWGGNVGIGTTTPGYKLDVTGDINFTGNIYKNGSLFSSGGGGSSGTVFSALSVSGTATIGTVSTPAYVDVTNGDPGDMISKQYSLATNGDRYGMGQYSTGTVRLFISGSYPNGSIRFSKATDNIRTAAAAFTDYMTISYAGNVGIGTTSPSYKFHIYDSVDGGVEHYQHNASAGTSAYTLIGCRNNTPSQLVMFINSSNRTADGGASTATVRNDAGDLRLQANGATNGLHIKASTGYVGVGTTTPSGLLHINSSALDYTNSLRISTAWPSIYLDGAVTGRSWSILNGGSGAGVGQGNFGIYDATAGAYRLSINSSGYVGMGMDSAGAKLDINKDGRTGTHGNTGNRGLYVTSNGAAYSDGMAEFRHTNGTQGIGIGYNGIYAAGSNANQEITLAPKGSSSVVVVNGDNSKIYFGPNASWGSALYVGAGTNSIAGATAQVISTNGNLHLDAGTGNHTIYLNYYSVAQAGAACTIESYGTFNHHSGNLNVDNSISAAGVTGGQVYTNDWFRVNSGGGLYWQAYGMGIQCPANGSASYGNITTYATGRNGWSGYSISSAYSFMSNGDMWGIYNMMDGKWMIYGNRTGITQLTVYSEFTDYMGSGGNGSEYQYCRLNLGGSNAYGTSTIYVYNNSYYFTVTGSYNFTFTIYSEAAVAGQYVSLGVWGPGVISCNAVQIPYYTGWTTVTFSASIISGQPCYGFCYWGPWVYYSNWVSNVKIYKV